MANEPKILDDQDFEVGGNDLRSPETKTFAEVIRVAIDQWVRNNLWVSLPGQIITVRNNSFVDVKPLIQELFIVQGAVSLPVLQNIPVEHPRGSDYWIKLPVAVGDYGKINFYDRSLDNWLVNGGGPLDPEDTRMHNLSDATFTPGLYPQSMVLPGNPDDLVVHNGDAEIYVQKQGTFKISNTATELISNLVNLVQTLSTASTVAGGPFVPSVVATLEEIIDNLQSLEGE